MGKRKTRKKINAQFESVFKGFIYPFDTSDNVIGKMSPDKRIKYYKEAVSLRDNFVNKQEYNEVCRKLYYDLAMEEDEDKRLVYKGALLFANRYWKRIRELAYRDEGQQEEAMEKAQENINELVGEK